MELQEDCLDRDSLSDYMKKISKFPLLSGKEEKILGFRIKEGDQEAREKLIDSNLRLVVYRAKKYQNRGLHLKDLINEGNFGLSKAVDYYDPNYKNKFSTYATWWIDQSIKKAIYQDSNLIRIPIWILNKKRRLESFVKIEPELLSKTPEEVSQKTGISLYHLNVLSKLPPNSVSLNSIVGHDTEMLDLLPDYETDLESQVSDVLLKDNLYSYISKLNEREQKILYYRFGLKNTVPHTLEETGKILGVTRERVRQIQKKAIEKLRSFFDNEDTNFS